MSAAQRAVTLACGGLQTCSIADDDLAPAATDHSSQRESLRNERYRRPSNSQHLGNSLLDHRHAFLIKGITGPQQPSAEACLDGMDGVTGRNLLRLQQQPTPAGLRDALD